jgi:hypothetical protein
MMYCTKEADLNAGLGCAQMLGRTNYIALVGGGKQPKFPQNKVRFYSLVLFLVMISDLVR